MDNAGDFSATFLPILTPPKYCKDKQDKLNSPIVIAWASRLGLELFYFKFSRFIDNKFLETIKNNS